MTKPPLDDSLPLVPFCPWRCPSCTDGKPFTYGRRGRVRYHRCKECGARYRSMMLETSELPTWGAGGAEVRELRELHRLLEVWTRKVPETDAQHRAWAEVWLQVEKVRASQGQQR